MRLLNVTTLEVESFAPYAVPKYAILSHRWTDDEVFFQDIKDGTARAKSGFAKLAASCSIARTEGLSHIWADMCCIDKSSSAELSEAINSMFRFYHDAEVCYAYLHDASGAADFLESDWFDRGWTLQELVAPRKVRFYDGKWASLGDLTSLLDSVSLRTGIAQAYLHGRDLSLASIAERMSWAARRKTTRPEDISYCLLGIFGIHMPLLYGEGAEKSFIRLQRELLKGTTDESWLAWGALPEKSKAGPASLDTDSDELSGVLAKSPAYFWNCRDVVVCHTSEKTPISTSNMGIHVDIPEISRLGDQILLLGCRWREDYHNVIGISVFCRMGRYYRASMDTVVEPETSWNEAARGVVKILDVDQYREPENPMDSLYVIEGIDPRFRLAEVFPPTAREPSPMHIRARRIGGEPSLPRRLLRLEHIGDDGGSDDPFDYILRLDGTITNRTWHPRYELGLLPKNVPLAAAEDIEIQYGEAVRVFGERGALSVGLEIKISFMTDTCAVKVYMDMTGAEDDPHCRVPDISEAQSRVLPTRPEEVQRLRLELRRRETIREAEEERALLEQSERRSRAQAEMAREAQEEAHIEQTLLLSRFFGTIVLLSTIALVILKRMDDDEEAKLSALVVIFSLMWFGFSFFGWLARAAELRRLREHRQLYGTF